MSGALEPGTQLCVGVRVVLTSEQRHRRILRQRDGDPTSYDLGEMRRLRVTAEDARSVNWTVLGPEVSTRGHQNRHEPPIERSRVSSLRLTLRSVDRCRGRRFDRHGGAHREVTVADRARCAACLTGQHCGVALLVRRVWRAGPDSRSKPLEQYRV